jgi:hypothetical protein
LTLALVFEYDLMDGKFNSRSKLKLRELPRSKVRFSKSEIEFQSLPLTCRNREDVLSCGKNITTLEKFFDRAIQLFGPNQCLGTRKVLKLLRVDQPGDTVLTKLDLVIQFFFNVQKMSEFSIVSSEEILTGLLCLLIVKKSI